MYETQVAGPDEALCHLLFHCCLKDGRLTEAELDKVSEIFVQFGLNHNLNFKNEIQAYRAYADSINNEQAYLNYLVETIKPVNELAILSWCIELAITDDNLSLEEEALLAKIAVALNVPVVDLDVITKLMVQRRVVLSEKIS
jgi:uncharacterized tellurite resistance protein B-like protein